MSTTEQRLVDALGGTTPDDAIALARLGATLAERAGAEGLTEVGLRRLDSPIGSLLVAVTNRGVLRVAFEVESHDAVTADLGEHFGGRVLAWPSRTDEVARQFDEYFAGRRRRFDLDLDLRLSRGFRREVLAHLVEVPYGATVAYGALAHASGRPRAVRAAASACATNPVPIVIPCHRVVRADGTFGEYRGGREAKHTLLALESGKTPPR